MDLARLSNYSELAHTHGYDCLTIRISTPSPGHRCTHSGLLKLRTQREAHSTQAITHGGLAGLSVQVWWLGSQGHQTEASIGPPLYCHIPSWSPTRVSGDTSDRSEAQITSTIHCLSWCCCNTINTSQM